MFKPAFHVFMLAALFFFLLPAQALTQGIYVTQPTLENTARLNYLIKRAKSSGIDTFIVDMDRPSKRYRSNIALLKQNNITYVARITMFPDGGTHDQIKNQALWEKRYALAAQAINLGATSIQLDYIRYKASQKASPKNAKRVLEVIDWFKSKLAQQGILLQIDVFGIASYGESSHIGQSIPLFAPSIDALCPMVYPSHYVPFAQHFSNPYGTVFDSLIRIKAMFNNRTPFKLYPYIELSNYHYPMSRKKTYEYIQAQLRAVERSGADGWYAWSPNNKYDNLFYLLESGKRT